MLKLIKKCGILQKKAQYLINQGDKHVRSAQRFAHLCHQRF
jgi:hypothetical protein